MTDLSAQTIYKSPVPPLLLLCTCEGKLLSGAALESIQQQMAGRFPGLQLKAEHKLCSSPRAVAESVAAFRPSSLVIGACRGRGYEEGWQEQASEGGLPAFFTEVVDLVGYSLSRDDPRAPALLAAAIAHQEGFRQAPLHALRPARLKTDAAVSRRSLLRLSFVRWYDVVPWIEAQRCSGPRGCDLCLKACPSKAIDPANARVLNSECANCGLCLSSCPSGALGLPGFRPHEQASALGELSSFGSIRSRIVAFALGRFPETWASLHEKGLAGGLLPLHLPQETLLRPSLLLLPLMLGAAGVAVFHCHPKGTNKEAKLAGEAELVNTLLGSAGIAGQRVAVFSTRDSEELKAEVGRFRTTLAVSETPTPLLSHHELSKVLGQGGLASLLKRLWKGKEGHIVPIAHASSPLATLSLDVSRCSACGICADRCPTGALQSSRSERGLTLSFEHGACPGCGLCVGICPEKALHLERRMEPDLILSDHKAELGFFPATACSSCGQPTEAGIRSHVMLERLSASSGQLSPKLKEALSLCFPCRQKRMFVSTRKSPANT